MYADDRVLVGVIKRKRDLHIARRQRWYRIPQANMRRGLDADYVAFFLSRQVFGERGGGIAYFARITGIELARRRDLLPKESQRADDVYYKVQFRDLIEKDPPIENVPARSISFIRTTWDRFVRAETISDLYSAADFYVDRVYFALRG
ncbi:MAG: hypothetical protein OXE95_05310 [Chloroflexi bacterium]|nr:hypothetical protein [Chloroflexota bacterium]MCY4246981.1 hypothetical protein [Chloroflexota bacterium]